MNPKRNGAIEEGDIQDQRYDKETWEQSDFEEDRKSQSGFRNFDKSR